MEDPAEQLIRRALGRRPPPTLGPTFADDVLRRVAEPQPAALRRVVPWRLGVVWLTAAVASATVLAHLEWSSPTRAVAWGLALGMVPLAYSATLWPEWALALLALCGDSLLGKPPEAPPAVTPAPPSRRRGETSR